MNRQITYFFQLFVAIEKVSDWGFVDQNAAHYTNDIECSSVEFAFMLGNGHEAVCDDRNINLYSHSILGCTPKGSDSQMLLYPSEEQLNLPSLFVKQGDVACLEREVVCQESERPLQFGSIVDYSPESSRIFLLGLIASNAYRLIKQNIIRIVQQFLAINHFVVEMRLLPITK